MISFALNYEAVQTNVTINNTHGRGNPVIRSCVLQRFKTLRLSTIEFVRTIACSLYCILCMYALGFLFAMFFFHSQYSSHEMLLLKHIMYNILILISMAFVESNTGISFFFVALCFSRASRKRVFPCSMCFSNGCFFYICCKFKYMTHTFE